MLQNDKQGEVHPEHGRSLPLIIEGTEYKWPHQYINGAEIKKLGKLSADSKLILAIQRPWEDEVIEDDIKVNLAREGIEQFYVRKPHEHVLVHISINGKKYEVKRGKYTVAELKRIGGVSAGDVMEEVINGKLTPLPNDGIVLIKGCEDFFSHKPDGTSS